MINQTYTISRGLTRIEVPHEAGRLAIAHPFVSRGTARDLRNQIRSNRIARLREPTLSECLSFGNFAYGNESEAEFVEATRIMKERYFRGYTATHTTDDEGLDNKLVYIVDFPDFQEDGIVTIDNSKLIKRLNANDRGIRTIPKSEMPHTGLRTPIELAQDKYVIALVGEEQAEIAARLAEKHPVHEGYVFVPNILTPGTTLAALGSGYGGGRLIVVGSDYELGRGWLFVWGV